MRAVFKKHLSRRTFIRGMGVTLSLPLLDSMVPAQTALAQTAAKPQIRVVLPVSQMLSSCRLQVSRLQLWGSASG